MEAIAGLAAGYPLAARAQQRAAAPIFGFLTIGLATQTLFVDGFRRGLKEAGFVEGQNVDIEYRSRRTSMIVSPCSWTISSDKWR